ncbi:MAG: universal stress protein [Armatimonadetes bacterium]|nr:universal stress protein [Armatimonadota bacterium]
MYRKILVPLDGSSLAEKALAPALDLARLASAEIVLVRASDQAALMVPMSGPYPPGPLPMDLVTRLRHEAERYLASVAQTVREAGLVVTWQVQEGHPAEVVLETARSEGADLIVMASHGRTGLSRFLLGSVAEKVLRRASCQVLLVPARVGEPIESERAASDSAAVL